MIAVGADLRAEIWVGHCEQLQRVSALYARGPRIEGHVESHLNPRA